MPTQPTVTDSRLNNILACLNPTIPLLNEVNDAFGTPFIKAISNTTLSLVTAVQSETAGSLSPAILDHVGKFTQTLHKIHTFVEAQQDGNRFKHFFRQSEMNTLHKNCLAGLEEALHFFKVETGLLLAESIAEMQHKTQNMHQKLLELVANLSDGSTSDKSSAHICSSIAGSQMSSTSFSLLPAQPKIFHGRQSELENIVTSITQGLAHIAILGAGGIGKTSLAKAALHHPHVAAKYETRVFIAADSSTSSIELAALIGSHLGLKAGKSPPCLLVLGNLDTPWEPLESHGGVEELLSLLTDIPHLALIITMRGAERPAKTFIEIADDCHDIKDIEKLLQLTDNMPLAVELIAHLVDYEGTSNVLARWQTEKTSMLSAGYGKGSNLDASIAMSLASPRMASHAGAKDLLSLLSVLPDGLSDVELGQCNLPIKDILGSRATLLQISMAYCDDKKRLKSLVPIREHIQHFYPLSQPLFHPLCQYFHSLLHIYKSNHRIEVAYFTEMLNTIYSSPVTNSKLLIDEAMAHLQDCNDPALQSDFFLSVGVYHRRLPDWPMSAKKFEQALSLAKLCEDSTRQANVLNQIARLKFHLGDLSAAQKDLHEAQQMAHISGNLNTQALGLRTEMACLGRLGNLTRAVLLGHREQELVQLCGLEGGPLDDGIMVNLAQIHMEKSEYQEARNLHAQLQNKSNPQHKYFNALTLMNIAEIDIILDAEFFDVQKNVENAKTTFGTLGSAGWVNACEILLADLSLRDGKASIAEKALLKCFNDAKNSSDKIYCLERLADVGRWTSTGITWPYTWTVIYLAFAHQGKKKLDLYKALRFLGDVFLSRGDEQTAHNFFVVALDRFTYMDIHRSRADCMLRLGDIAEHRGDLVKAEEFWKKARPLFERSSQVKDIVQIDARLSSINQDVSATHQEALVQLTGLWAPLDEVSNQVSNDSDKSGDTASGILEETPWVTA
ncbi:hypothetical protein C8R44DRAFT_725941 [Mycena epipterygia]|nr:hypothetical protein C8R44DRAFT_725941 [Mycena epipterygia]